MNYLFHLTKLLTEVFTDVQGYSFVQISLIPPMIMECGDIDAHLLGDHPGGGAVKPVLTKYAASQLQDFRLHGVWIFSGFL